MIEFIGVLAVMAILAAALVPFVIKRIDQAARTKEIGALTAISTAYTQYVVRSNTIPDEFTWAETVSSQLDLSANDIRITPRKYNRCFLYDKGGWLYWLNTNQSPAYYQGASLYVQGPGGMPVAPSNAKIMVVSTLAVTNPIPTGPIDSATFSAMWDTPQGSKPGISPWTAWKGSGDDVLIQRVNLEPLLHRVVLVNNDVGSTPYFRVNGTTNPVPVAPGGGWKSYYLNGTMLGLCDTNAGLPGVMVQEVIRKDISRVFELGYWRDEIGMGVHTNGLTDFTTIAAIFFNTTNPPVSLCSWGPTPKGVADIFDAYMFGYASFASTKPCFAAINSTGNDNNNTPYSFTVNAQLLNDTLTLITKNNAAGTLVPSGY
jgi:type II secretory pathway pseudopilin PulG